MPIRCAVAGLGRGSTFVTLLSSNPNCEVVAVCDPRQQQLDAHSGIEGFTDFEEMLEKSQPQVVAIISPGPLHAGQSVAALEAGVNVLVETPNVYSVAEAETIVRLARANGSKYMLAEDYIYMGWCRRLAAIVETGGLGTILGGMGEYVHDCRSFVFADESGQTVPFSRAGEPGVTPLWRLTDLPPLCYSSHTLGPLLALMDDRCTSASGVCAGRQEVAGVEVFPLETAVLQTAKGAAINLTNGFILGHPMSFFYALYGTTGAVRVMSAGGLKTVVATDDGGGEYREMDLPWADRDDGKDHLQVMVDEFIDSVREDTSPPFDEARSMDFCLPGVLAHESAKQGGQRLEIPLY